MHWGSILLNRPLLGSTEFIWVHLSSNGLKWAQMAQLGLTGLNLAQLGSTWLNWAQLVSTDINGARSSSTGLKRLSLQLAHIGNSLFSLVQFFLYSIFSAWPWNTTCLKIMQKNGYWGNLQAPIPPLEASQRVQIIFRLCCPVEKHLLLSGCNVDQ